MFEKNQFGPGMMIAALSIAAGVALLVHPPPFLSDEEARAAALTIITISFWATGIIPEYLTALFFFLFAMLFAISPPHVVFSGFQSTAMWMIFSGLVISVAITGTGFGNRIAAKFVRYLVGGYFRLIGGIVSIGILLAFFMPAGIGRVLLLLPIVLAMADHFGFQKGSNGRKGLVMAAVFGAIIPGSAILPANVPNMVLVGMSETQFQISPLYGEYLLLHFPVLGALKAIIIIGLILWLYPDRPANKDIAEVLETGPVTRNEKILAVIICLLLTLWMTDFVHHISPAWVALGCALVMLLPKVGIVSGKEFNEKINFSILFLAAGVLGLGGIVNHSGLGDTLANGLTTLLPLGEGKLFLNYISLCLISAATGLATTLPGIPAVITPLSDTLAQATGMPLKAVLMTQVLGFSTPLLPYQLPPIIVGMQLSGEKLSEAAKFCLYLAAITFLFLLPLDYFWWRALGWI